MSPLLPGMLLLCRLCLCSSMPFFVMRCHRHVSAMVVLECAMAKYQTFTKSYAKARSHSSHFFMTKTSFKSFSQSSFVAGCWRTKLTRTAPLRCMQHCFARAMNIHPTTTVFFTARYDFSKGAEMEMFFLQLLLQEHGIGFVSRMQRMIDDIESETARSTETSFKEWVSEQRLQLADSDTGDKHTATRRALAAVPKSLGVLALTKSVWPPTAVTSVCDTAVKTVAPSLRACEELFSQYYSKRFPARQLVPLVTPAFCDRISTYVCPARSLVGCSLGSDPSSFAGQVPKAGPTYDTEPVIGFLHVASGRWHDAEESAQDCKEKK